MSYRITSLWNMLNLLNTSSMKVFASMYQRESVIDNEIDSKLRMRIFVHQINENEAVYNSTRRGVSQKSFHFQTFLQTPASRIEMPPLCHLLLAQIGKPMVSQMMKPIPNIPDLVTVASTFSLRKLDGGVVHLGIQPVCYLNLVQAKCLSMSRQGIIVLLFKILYLVIFLLSNR